MLAMQDKCSVLLSLKFAFEIAIIKSLERFLNILKIQNLLIKKINEDYSQNTGYYSKRAVLSGSSELLNLDLFWSFSNKSNVEIILP